MLPWLPARPSSLISDVRDTSLGKMVRDEMLNLILSGQLLPGQRINEPDLAARLGVSRVPVHEALRELESSGLVAARKHMGVFVRVLDDKEVAELYELRSVLDGHAAWKAARLPDRERRALGKRLAALTSDMKTCAKSHDVRRYYVGNLAFHWAFIEAADNRELERLYRGIVQQLHVTRLKNLSQRTGMQLSIAEHQKILEALADGDAARCRLLLMAHVSSALRRLQVGPPVQPVRARSRKAQTETSPGRCRNCRAGRSPIPSHGRARAHALSHVSNECRLLR